VIDAFAKLAKQAKLLQVIKEAARQEATKWLDSTL
jgi:hypothetical protein